MPKVVTAKSFQKKVLLAKKPVIVEFCQSDCEECLSKKIRNEAMSIVFSGRVLFFVCKICIAVNELKYSSGYGKHELVAFNEGSVIKTIDNISYTSEIFEFFQSIALPEN
ncbi:hypothetical protein HYS99_01550 [Candidatus Giovannonibacteria bacterium]|nr:hypothetical protein [Candidatus Giovannonibacteria bacterium]